MLDGMKARHLCNADLHVHSCRSHDVPDLEPFTPRALFEQALEREGMDYFALTDHDTMAGYEELIRRLPEGERRLVIPGVEHTLRDPEIGFALHANLLMITPDQYAEIRRRIVRLPELAEYCRSRGIFMQYNHPTWWERAELRAGRVRLERVIYAAEFFDALEINAKRTRMMNTITANLARSLEKPLTCNSDTHAGELGLAYNRAPAETAQEFLENIWSGRALPIISHMTDQSLLNMAHTVIDSLFAQPEGLCLTASARQAPRPRLERFTRRLLSSRRVMRNRVTREPLRALLKHAARPFVRGVMARERNLERSLCASGLRRYI